MTKYYYDRNVLYIAPCCAPLVMMRTAILLDGPCGNAFALLGRARIYALQMNRSEAWIASLVDDMMSGDYEHLLTIFYDEFSAYVELYRSIGVKYKVE